jgi:hypothetical protein
LRAKKLSSRNLRRVEKIFEHHQIYVGESLAHPLFEPSENVDVNLKENQGIPNGQLTLVALHGLQPIEENRLSSSDIILLNNMTDALAPIHQDVLGTEFVTSVSDQRLFRVTDGPEITRGIVCGLQLSVEVGNQRRRLCLRLLEISRRVD